MRKFLVVLDDSRECLNAMRFAAMRAAKTGGGVEILSIIAPEEFNHWLGVGTLMREEARERIEGDYDYFRLLELADIELWIVSVAGLGAGKFRPVQRAY